MPPSRSTLALAAGLFAAACGGSQPSVAAVAPTSPAPAIGSTVLGGATDGLAVELLLASATTVLPTWHAQQIAVSDPEVAIALDATALDHLRSTAFGAGTGPLLVGSAAIRRLAASPGAPADQNGDGTNLDETLGTETERITAFAGATMPRGATLPLFAWRSRSADLRAPLSAGNDPSPSWATTDLGDRTLRMAEIGQFLQLRAIASRRLLLPRHRGRYGASADEGTLGLLAMQQLLAAEDSLFATMFTSGGPLGPLEDPDAYDPGVAPRWLPNEVAVDLDPGLAGAAVGWRAIDDASDLTALASLLRAATELMAVTDPGASFGVPELFRARPFHPPPRTPVPASISWSRDIGPLLTFRCGACHRTQTFGGFSITSYESMRLGGVKTRALHLALLVPGNAQASLLHQILVGPPPPFVRMPFGGELPVGEIARIDAWIDAGALKDPPVAPSPPLPGQDLARVSFKNLVALHFDEATGALHHRREADGPSGVATSLATGRALAAVAQLDRVAADFEFRGWTPRTLLARLVESAATNLVDGTGRCLDAFGLAANVPAAAADLRAQAAMSAGLWEAASRLPAGHPAHELAQRTAVHLLEAFADPATGLFAAEEHGAAGSYTAATLTDLLAALRLAAAAAVPGAAERRTELLRRLLPVLAFAEWSGHGEVLGDGLADTDLDGLPEPAAAGGPFGRLPLLTNRIVVDARTPAADRPVSWSEHVRPLLQSKCGECHLGGNERGHYRLDTVRSLATPGESLGALPMLVPGDPDSSFFFQKLADRRPALGMQMPLQRPPLDELSVALVRRWIHEGATGR